jgi:hypothetical protein
MIRAIPFGGYRQINKPAFIISALFIGQAGTRIKKRPISSSIFSNRR